GANDVTWGSRGERGDRRPALEPSLVTGDDACDLRLLEHDLRHEDRVGIPRRPPRELATARREPACERYLHPWPTLSRCTGCTLAPLACPPPSRRTPWL